jgi:hypothetical protein
LRSTRLGGGRRSGEVRAGKDAVCADFADTVARDCELVERKSPKP